MPRLIITCDLPCVVDTINIVDLDLCAFLHQAFCGSGKLFDVNVLHIVSLLFLV